MHKLNLHRVKVVNGRCRESEKRTLGNKAAAVVSIFTFSCGGNLKCTARDIENNYKLNSALTIDENEKRKSSS